MSKPAGRSKLVRRGLGALFCIGRPLSLSNDDSVVRASVRGVNGRGRPGVEAGAPPSSDSPLEVETPNAVALYLGKGDQVGHAPKPSLEESAYDAESLGGDWTATEGASACPTPALSRPPSTPPPGDDSRGLGATPRDSTPRAGIPAPGPAGEPSPSPSSSGSIVSYVTPKKATPGNAASTRASYSVSSSVGMVTPQGLSSPAPANGTARPRAHADSSSAASVSVLGDVSTPLASPRQPSVNFPNAHVRRVVKSATSVLMVSPVVDVGEDGEGGETRVERRLSEVVAGHHVHLSKIKRQMGDTNGERGGGRREGTGEREENDARDGGVQPCMDPMCVCVGLLGVGCGVGVACGSQRAACDSRSARDGSQPCICQPAHGFDGFPWSRGADTPPPSPPSAAPPVDLLCLMARKVFNARETSHASPEGRSAASMVVTRHPPRLDAGNAADLPRDPISVQMLSLRSLPRIRTGVQRSHSLAA